MSTAVLIHSKDCNRELTTECINQIKKFIPNRKIYVTSENLPINESGVTNILTGDGFWSDRLKVALSKIDEDNIIFFLEDMIVKNIESLPVLDTCINFHEAYSCNMTKLGNHAWFNGIETNIHIDKYNVYIQNGGLYVMSHQPVTIFNKNFLLSSLKPGQTPWQHEGAWVNLKPVPEKIFIIGLHHNNIEHIQEGTDLGSIVEYYHALSKGERIEYVGKYK